MSTALPACSKALKSTAGHLAVHESMQVLCYTYTTGQLLLFIDPFQQQVLLVHSACTHATWFCCRTAYRCYFAIRRLYMQHGSRFGLRQTFLSHLACVHAALKRCVLALQAQHHCMWNLSRRLLLSWARRTPW